MLFQAFFLAVVNACVADKFSVKYGDGQGLGFLEIFKLLTGQP